MVAERRWSFGTTPRYHLVPALCSLCAALVGCATSHDGHGRAPRGIAADDYFERVRKQTVVKESRWTVTYLDPETQGITQLSKFMTGDASITVDELRNQWPKWELQERLDFCGSLDAVPRDIVRDLLRYVIKNGDHDSWSEIALLAGRSLPSEEAVPFLTGCLDTAPPGKGSNFAQALASEKTREAREVIASRLESIWSDPGLLSTNCPNNVASEAINLIDSLTRLGVVNESLSTRARILLSHPNEGTRDLARNRCLESLVSGRGVTNEK